MVLDKVVWEEVKSVGSLTIDEALVSRINNFLGLSLTLSELEGIIRAYQEGETDMHDRTYDIMDYITEEIDETLEEVEWNGIEDEITIRED